MPKVLNTRDGMPVGAIYCGRGGRWGNPYRIGERGDRDAVIALHEWWLAGQHGLLRSLDTLRGKDLVCFCAPQRCHADLLLRLANATREQRITWWRGAAAQRGALTGRPRWP
jgi:hypothetical protein